MYSIVTDPLIWIVLTGIIGLVVGYLLSQGTIKSQIAAAKESEREKFEKEKLMLSEDLSSQLIKMRSGLIETISAYRDAVHLVTEKLPAPTKFNELSEAETAPQLELVFNGADTRAESQQESQLPN